MVSNFEREYGSNEVPAWVLPPASCAFVAQVAALFPDGPVAFEFGSGRSTHVLRAVTRQLTTVEDSEKWLQQTEQAPGAVRKRAEDHTAVIPLTGCWNRLRRIASFDLGSNEHVLARLRASQIILVDSPPNPAKREHALYVALRSAPIGAVIVIDDLEVRAVSRFASRLARQNQRVLRFWLLNIDHRLGVFLKMAPGRIRSMPSIVEFVGTWLRAGS